MPLSNSKITLECYFHDQMAERNLLCHGSLAEALDDYNPDAPEAEQLNYLEALEARILTITQLLFANYLPILLQKASF